MTYVLLDYDEKKKRFSSFIVLSNIINITFEKKLRTVYTITPFKRIIFTIKFTYIYTMRKFAYVSKYATYLEHICVYLFIY